MSTKHPIVAITGSSGAGTSNVKVAFEQIFQREGIKPAIIEGDCFHRYNRKEMDAIVTRIEKEGGNNVTHFGPEGNLFGELEAVFAEYAERGTGKRRYYIHNEEEAARHGAVVGELTPWEPLSPVTDLLFYEGLHGGLVTDKVNIAQHVDLLIGVVPIINLEWIQKIHRDKTVRGYSSESATRMILRRMYDYTHYITPQFSRTDINFQRVPTVDTSNPFATTEIPTNDQSFSVIHIRNPEKIKVDFRYLLEMLNGSFMSAPDTIVVPAGKKIFAMQLIITPVIHQIMENRKK
jgi:phosphoribulokinase